MTKIRKQSDSLGKILERIKQRDIENPVVREFEEVPDQKTDIENIKELQEIIVQTVIDYINKNGLTDIDAVYFNADRLKESAECGKWAPCTDSSITVRGIKCSCRERKDGTIDRMPYWYDIGSCM